MDSLVLECGVCYGQTWMNTEVQQQNNKISLILVAFIKKRQEKEQNAITVLRKIYIFFPHFHFTL